MGLSSLEGDGVSDVILSWLHAKDELGYGPSVWLPDTVVFKFGQPVHWYFTSSVDGKLKKKSKQNLVNVRIEEAFTKRSIACDVVAYYISEVAVDSCAKMGTTIEYFDRPGLHEFLYNRWKENNGMLQHFIQPKGVHNAIIRAIWSPKVCLLERRLNSKQLYDKRYGLYERSVTYEGPEHYSVAAPLRGTTLPSQIQRLCENLVSHISEVSFQKHSIVRMITNFKVDSRDRLWFLWSSSIRLSGHGHTPVRSLDINPTMQLPTHIRLVDQPNHSLEESEPLTCISCISCGKTATSDQFHPVQYRTIVAHFERVVFLSAAPSLETNNGVSAKWPPDPLVIEAAGGVGFGRIEAGSKVAIPPIIKHLHPKLLLPVYKRYRRDPLFMYKTAVVCENCFLVYAEFASCSKVKMITTTTADAENRHMTKHLLRHLPSHTKRGSSSIKQAKMMMHGQIRNKPLIASAPSVPSPIYRASKIDAGGGSHEKQDLCRALSIDEIVHNREESFFNEVRHEINIQGGHPLTHLITSFRSIQRHSAENLGAPCASSCKGPYGERPTTRSTAKTKVSASKNCQREPSEVSRSSKAHREFLLSTHVPASCEALRP